MALTKTILPEVNAVFDSTNHLVGLAGNDGVTQFLLGTGTEQAAALAAAGGVSSGLTSVVSGDTDRIVVTSTVAGVVTLSGPQDINTTSSPTFVGATLSGLTANAAVYSGVGGAITSTAAPTNGQVLIGSTGAAPALGTLTGTANRVTVTNSAGGITLTSPQDIATTSDVVLKTVQAAILNKNAATTAAIISGTVGGVITTGSPSARAGLPFGSVSLDLSAGGATALGPVIIDVTFNNSVDLGAVASGMQGFSIGRDTTTGVLYGGTITRSSSTVLRLTITGALTSSLGNTVTIYWIAFPTVV